MHILLFYQYYHNPDCAATGRHYQLVRSLCKHHRVTILTSDIWERKRQSYLYDWAPEGATVHSFRVPYENAMSSPERLKAYAGYAFHAIRKALSLSQPDVIIGSSTPLSAAWAAAKTAQMRRLPWIFEVRDLWPDFPIQMGAIGSKTIQKVLFRMEKQLYRSASHIVTLSPDMESHVRSKGIAPEKTTTLLNGTDLALADRVTDTDIEQLKKTHGIDDKKVILYAGTFGRANAIPLLIHTAKSLHHRRDVHFVFLGSGYFEPHLKAAAHRLDNLTVLPPEPRYRVFHWFRLASISLVSFLDLPVLEANSPAKFFDSLATGTPVIVTNPGWTRTFVEANACGWYASNQELGSVVRCIEQAIDDPELLERTGQKGYEVARKQFDRAPMGDQLDEIIRQSVSLHKPEPLALAQ